MLIITGCGNLTKDPEKIEIEKGTLCRMTIAVNELYTKNGERQTQYFNLVAWNNLADNCLKYLKKGDKIAIVGNPQSRVYENSEGIKKNTFEIVCSEIEWLDIKKH